MSDKETQPTRMVDWLTPHFPDPAQRREYAQERCVVAFGSELQRVQEAAGLSDAELAEKIGLSVSRLRRSLNNLHGMTLRRLADILWACDVEVIDPEKAFGHLGIVETADDTPTPPPPSETRDLAVLRIYGTFRRSVLKAYHKGDWEAVSVALGAFNTSCDTLPPLDEPKIIQSSVPPSETKLRALLDELDYQEAVAVGQALRYGNPEYGLAQSERSALAISDARKARSAARSSLESLYRDLEIARDDARRVGGFWKGEYKAVNVELSALRSLQLTEEERQFITGGLLLHAPGWRIPDTLSEKLRISSKATSEEL